MPFISSVRGSYGAQGRFGRRKLIGVGSTGGTITTAGGYRIHTFTTTGASAFVADGPGTVEYLIIAGGGSGGPLGGGGGAGGYLAGSTDVSAASYVTNVGSGGQTHSNTTGHVVDGNNGLNSTVLGLTALGGGFGSFYNRSSGSAGGSGGGAGAHMSGGGGGASAVGQNAQQGSGVQSNQGAGTTGQGHAGGTGLMTGYVSVCNQAGGSAWAGAGGPGISSSITGTSVARGGGGGGGTYYSNVRALGGSGGGGRGGVASACGTTDGENGTDGTGGGGGGAGHDKPGGYISGNGGNGIIIIRYPV